MKNINWEDFLEANKKNADLSMNKFLEKVNNHVDKHLPIKKLSKQEILQKDKPWMTKGLITSIKNKNIIHQKMLRAKDPTRKQELQEKHKTCKNRLTKLTRNSKANHFNNFFYQNKSNLLKVWEGIKSIINTKPTKIKQDIATIKVDKQIISDKEKIAETINEFFVDIPRKIESIIQPSKKHYKQYLGEPPADVFSLTAVTPHEVEVKIKSLKNNY